MAGIITAIAAAITALGGLALALGVMIPNLRATRAGVKATEEVKAATAEVHTMVNQQRTDMMRYQAALVEALRVAGVDIPPDQSLGAAPLSMPPPTPQVKP